MNFTDLEKDFLKRLSQTSAKVNLYIHPTVGAAVIQVKDAVPIAITPEDLRTWAGLLNKYADIAEGFVSEVQDDTMPQSQGAVPAKKGTIQVLVAREE